MNRYIQKGIEEFIGRNYAPWHMPGHKRRRLEGEEAAGASPLYDALDKINEYDVTELGETDDYLRPEGFFKEALNELRTVYGSAASFYLVNGSTSGIQAAVCACSAKRAEARKILVGADCHRSVHNIARLIGLEVVRLDTANCDSVTNGLDENDFVGLTNKLVAEDFCAIVITSPDYDGVCKDVKRFAEFAHSLGLPLIVDEAHGAHLWFSEKQRKLSAICNDADIVVQSLHKTMPSPTQTAIIHAMNEDYAGEVQEKLEMLLSSSPSFPMLAAMERAVAWADENRASFDKHIERVEAFVKRLSGSGRRIGEYSFDSHKAAHKDKTRICLAAEGISGEALEQALLREGIVVEMSAPDHVVLISTVMDDEEAFDKLFDAVIRASSRLDEWETIPYNNQTNVVDMIGSQAEEDIYVYPPGSPIVLKGQTIDETAAKRIAEYIKAGKKIHGLR